MKPSIRPSVQPTTNQLINQSIDQSINQSFVPGSFVLSVSSLLVLLIPSFVPSFIHLCAKMSLFCRSSWIPPFSKGSTSLTTEGTYNQSFVPLGSIGPSVGVSFVFFPSFLPSFIHAFTLLGTKMSLFCRSSWIPPFSKVSTSLTKEGTSINQSFVLGSFGLSVIILFVFLPSFIQVGTKISLFCRSSWIPPFSKGSTSLTKQGRSTNHSINHSLWARSVSQSVVCSSSYHPSFLHSFN